MFGLDSKPNVTLCHRKSVRLSLYLKPKNVDSERNYPSLLCLQSRENKAFLPLPLDARKLKGFRLQGAKLCPWTPPGA